MLKLPAEDIFMTLAYAKSERKYEKKLAAIMKRNRELENRNK